MTTATFNTQTLAHFCSSGEFFANTLRRDKFVNTEGMQYVAESAGAYWLLDAAASYQGSGLDSVCRGLQVWKLRRLPKGCRNMAELTCWAEDRRVVRQLIPYTDFPFDALESDTFEFWVEGDGSYRWTALLPTEH